MFRGGHRPIDDERMSVRDDESRWCCLSLVIWGDCFLPTAEALVPQIRLLILRKSTTISSDVHINITLRHAKLMRKILACLWYPNEHFSWLTPPIWRQVVLHLHGMYNNLTTSPLMGIGCHQETVKKNVRFEEMKSCDITL